MAHVTDRDYAKMADAVAEDLIANNIALNDSIAKLACDMGLTDEQVCRLCEATNNTTFNKLFKAREKTANDRLIEFDVADSKKVLGQLIKKASAPTVEKTAALLDLYELEDEMHSVRHPESEPESDAREALTKVAFELRPHRRVDTHAERAKLAKAKDHLVHAKLAAEMLYHGDLRSLKAEFSKLYNDMPFTTLEKQAAARWGVDAVPVLNDLRQQLRLPEAVYDIDKAIKLAGWVDDTHPLMVRIAQLIETRKEVQRLTAGIAKVAAVIG